MKKVSAVALLGLLVSTVLCGAFRANAAVSRPDAFLSVLDRLRAKTKVGVLLPH
jgi:hypothetical protein